VSRVVLKCAGCDLEFEKSGKEHRRQLKNAPHRRFYCSRNCYARSEGKKNLGSHLGVGNPANLRPDNRRDALSPFRYFMNKARNRPLENDLDLSYLASVWEGQSDPTRGYVRGNVRFVTLMGNLARNRFSDTDLIAFCEAVVRNQTQSSSGDDAPDPQTETTCRPSR